MSKMILKTILNTLLGIFGGFALVWGIISLAFPSFFISFFYDLGMYKASAWYAASSYVRSKELDDLAVATEMSIIAEYDRQVVKYGEIFVRMDGFDEFCAVQDENTGNKSNYEQWIYGQISVSYYRMGNEEKALETAFRKVPETLEAYSAISALSYEFLGKEEEDFTAADKELCEDVLENLEGLEIERTKYYEQLVSWLKDRCGIEEYYE